jgi:hypothetical protein
MGNNEESNEKQKDRLEKAIDFFAAGFTDHPGFMWTNTGFEVLHADWPAYPNGHGYKQVLATLAEFPTDVEFYPVDNIDRCTLFVADKIPKNEPYNKNLYHIAIWNEDLRECADRNLIEGISISGEYIEYPLGYISVSPAGAHAVLLNELTSGINPSIINQVEDLLHLHHYDDAVRRATVYLENRLRIAINGDNLDYGEGLLRKCFGENALLFPQGLPNTRRVEIRASFRRLFKYVRNDFAHNLRSMDVITAIRLLRRSSHLLDLLRDLENELDRAKNKPNK